MNRIESKSPIPHEIRLFFSQPGGRSLMVIGGPGTGKTTFALQLLEEIADPEKSFYLSTRVSDEALYSQFPWLKDKDMKNRIIDSSRILLSTLYNPEEDEKPEMSKEEMERLHNAREFLQSIEDEPLAPPSKVDRTRLTTLIERNRMPEIERIYDKVDSLLPQKSMLIIDSIEGITNKYNIEPEEFITCIQKDLVEGSNVDTVFVLEKVEDANLGFLVDGVIKFSHGEIEGRRIRNIHLNRCANGKDLEGIFLYICT